jgi:hypothetical protein
MIQLWVISEFVYHSDKLSVCVPRYKPGFPVGGAGYVLGIRGVGPSRLVSPEISGQNRPPYSALNTMYTLYYSTAPLAISRRLCLIITPIKPQLRLTFYHHHKGVARAGRHLPASLPEWREWPPLEAYQHSTFSCTVALQNARRLTSSDHHFLPRPPLVRWMRTSWD